MKKILKIFQIPNMPLSLGWGEWENWEKQSKKKYPIRFLLSHTIPRFVNYSWYNYIHTPWYRLKCVVWHKYNVVTVKSLSPTWHDRDNLLLYASFQILEDFIDIECPYEFSRSYEETLNSYLELGCEQEAVERADSWKLIRKLYQWWLIRKDKDSWDNETLDEDDNEYEEDTKKLKELADIRMYLWT